MSTGSAGHSSVGEYANATNNRNLTTAISSLPRSIRSLEPQTHELTLKFDSILLGDHTT